MSDRNETFSELVEIVRLNGYFRRRYGKIIGGYLYLRSVSAARGQTVFRSGLVVAAVAGVLAWLQKFALVRSSDTRQSKGAHACNSLFDNFSSHQAMLQTQSPLDGALRHGPLRLIASGHAELEANGFEIVKVG